MFHRIFLTLFAAIVVFGFGAGESTASSASCSGITDLRNGAHISGGSIHGHLVCDVESGTVSATDLAASGSTATPAGNPRNHTADANQIEVAINTNISNPTAEFIGIIVVIDSGFSVNSVTATVDTNAVTPTIVGEQHRFSTATFTNGFSASYQITRISDGEIFTFTISKQSESHTIPAFEILSGSSNPTTEQVNTAFMLNRAHQILANQPRIIGFVDGSNTSRGGALGNLSLNGNADSMEVAFATSLSKVKGNAADKRIAQAFGKNDGEQAALSNYDQPSRAGTWDIWTEVHGARSDNGASDSDFWVGYVGIHKFLSENMLIGLLGQFDWADETNASVGSNAEGQGWMIGPYLAGQIPGQNLFYEARASWGRSNNTVSPIGTYRDDFDTTRWLVSGKINGSYDLGDVTMRPELQVSYFEEAQESYTDSLATVIAAQTISLGELRFGPTFTRTIETANGATIQPMIGVSGVWNFGIQNNNASQSFTIGNDDVRARFDAGLSASNDMGWTLTLAAYYDGLGADDYEALGGSIRLAIPIN